MKKQYTKKQITEAIAYWKKQLGAVNEEGPAAGNGPADAARRTIEDRYEHNQKSRAESDELFEGVQDVKPL